MSLYCDYDSLTHYQPGEFASKYAENLEGKLELTKKDTSLKDTEVDSFLYGNYDTFITKSPIVLYRLYGRYQKTEPLSKSETADGAWLKGRYASTEFAESCIDAKMRLALKPEWKNTKMYEAKILVPEGIEINVGIVAPVIQSGGTIFPGGAPQIILPKDWPDEWIQGYRHVSGRQLQIEPIFWPNQPEEIAVGQKALYPGICPRCCYWKTRKLVREEEFTIIGSKGTRYTMKRVCLNPSCGYYW